MANKVADALGKVLADTFILYFKTHSFHWNVTGPNFKALHSLFEEQYNEMWTATDEIAERIRALGDFAPNNMEELIKKASLRGSSQTPDAAAMIEMLAEDHRTLSKSIAKAIKIAQEKGDEGSADILINRQQAHDKAAWMLESSMDK